MQAPEIKEQPFHEGRSRGACLFWVLFIVAGFVGLCLVLWRIFV